MDFMQQCCCMSLYGRLWAAFEAVVNGETCQGALRGNTGTSLFLSISDGKKMVFALKKKKKNNLLSPEVDFSHVCIVCVLMYEPVMEEWGRQFVWKQRKQHVAASPKTPAWEMNSPLTCASTWNFSCTWRLKERTAEISYCHYKSNYYTGNFIIQKHVLYNDYKWVRQKHKLW